MSKRMHIVINPAAGQPEPILHILNSVFRPADVQWNVSITQEFGDATRQARQAVENGADVVVAYGGDGTVMEVVNGLIGTEAALGIVPGGTGNVLSIELDIPQASEEAAQLLVSPDAQMRQVDVGLSGERSFILRAYVGFDAQRIQMTTREMRDRYGKLAYLIAALKAIPESTSIRYRLTLDDKDVECEGFTCEVVPRSLLVRLDDDMLPRRKIDARRRKPFHPGLDQAVPAPMDEGDDGRLFHQDPLRFGVEL
jgi:diacylglycerol kinase family enzyme